MKITQQDLDQLVAQENDLGTLVLAIVLAGISILLPILLPVFFRSQLRSGNSSYVASLILLAATLFTLFLWQRITLSINKASHTLTITRKWLVRSKNQTFDTAQVQSVQLTSDTSIDRSQSGPDRVITYYRLLLQMKDGTSQDISDASTSRNNGFSLQAFSPKKPNESIGKAIASFLGVPFQEITPAALMQRVLPDLSQPLQPIFTPSVTSTPSQPAVTPLTPSLVSTPQEDAPIVTSETEEVGVSTS